MRLVVQQKVRQYVHVFAAGGTPRGTEGDASMRALLGQRGASLSDLARRGLPVSPGLTISAEACAYSSRHGGQLPACLADQVASGVRRIETAAGRRLADPKNPLLIDLRFDAAAPVRGLPPDLTGIGLNDAVVAALARMPGAERSAWDAYRRFIEVFGSAVVGEGAGLGARDFESERVRLLSRYGAAPDAAVDAPRLRDLCEAFKRMFLDRARQPFPQDGLEQFRQAVRAAYRAWADDDADRRRHHAAGAGLIGTAVTATVRVPVCSDAGALAGRAVTRDPVTGENRMAGRVYAGAGIGDRTSGVRMTMELADWVRERVPDARRLHESISDLLHQIEVLRRYPQEVEFAVEQGRVWLLEAVAARPEGWAGVRWVVEMTSGQDLVTGRAQPRLMKTGEALQALTTADVEALMSPAAGDRPPGARRRKPRADPAGILYRQVSDWIDRARDMEVHAVASDLKEASAGKSMGADGIGMLPLAALCDSGEGRWALRELLLAEEGPSRRQALDRLRKALADPLTPFFSALHGHGVIVRLLDVDAEALLHWREADDSSQMARRLGVAEEEVARRRERLQRRFAGRAVRGCRLMQALPSLVEIEAAAVAEAASAAERQGCRVKPSVLVPWFGEVGDFEECARILRAAAETSLREHRSRLRLRVGAAVETPRIALLADRLAESADFLCFDLQELTRCLCGLDRGEAVTVGGNGVNGGRGLSAHGPAFDQEGTGLLIEEAVRKARSVRHDLVCGAVGAAAEDAAAMRFLQRIGIDYVVCPAPRVPLARLAAAQAVGRG